MPELPEVEAWRRGLNDPVSAFPIEKAGPAHVATLKTIDPPLRSLEGRRFSGAERRGKWFRFPTDDGELVLLVHLMSAGRLRYLGFGEKGPKVPAFQVRFEGGGRLILTEGRLEEARRRLAAHSRRPPRRSSPRLGPEALGLGAERLGEILAARVAPAAPAPARPARDRRHRARVVERDPAHGAALALPALDPALIRGGRAPRRRDRRGADPRPRPPRPRREGREGLPRPQPPRRAVPRLRRPAPARRLRRAHDLLLPAVPDRRARAQGPPDVAAAALARTGS